jgi:hypothetical protein
LHTVDVYITIDTEVWPRNSKWTESDLAADLEQDVYGRFENGEVGILYQMDVLESFGLRAVFFVESLFASAAGPEDLSRLVDVIQKRGHEVQLHVHSEWLQLGAGSVLPNKTGKNLKNFSLDDQTLLIETALRNLRKSGANDVCAFRAGNCGANFDTLRALARLAIPCDSSYNPFYLRSQCDLRTERLLVQPSILEGIHEFPIACFQDWPGHYRHAQIGACSAAEMQWALLGAHRGGWQSFVILSHSFELLKGRHVHRGASPDVKVVQRFTQLCQFLGENRHRFRSAVFSERHSWPKAAARPETMPLRSNMARTGWRYVEQLSRKLS